MIKAVLFDLDNTLIDFMRMKRLACEAAIDAMRDAGLDINKENGLKILFSLYSEYGLEYQRIFQVFLKELIGKVDYAVMAAGIVAYRRVKEGLLEPYPKVRATLQKLKKKYKLAIISDAPRIQVWIRLVAMGIQDKFDLVITFDDTKKKKPDIKPFLVAAKKLKLNPNEIAMVGDSIKRDLNSARKLGMLTILAEYGQIKREKGKVDYKIKNINQLTKIL